MPYSFSGKQLLARIPAGRATSGILAAAVVALTGAGTAAFTDAPAAKAEASVQQSAAGADAQRKAAADTGAKDTGRGKQHGKQVKKAEAAKPAKKRVVNGKKADRSDAQRAARGKARKTHKPATGWTSPVNRVVFSAKYGQPGGWASGYHTGIDFVIPTGTPVYAVGPGTVVTAGYDSAYGNNVVIRHTDGRYTQYAHLSSLDVSAGQRVRGGKLIGLSGSTGNSTGPHLHFEARTAPGYGSDTNPLAYLRSHGVRI